MDRRTLIRQYKETRRPMGIYQVRNTRNGKCYIGTAADLPAILNSNRAQLRLGVHSNRELQQDWNALGPDHFTFEVLDTLKPPDQPDYDPTDDLRTLESLWLERLMPFDERGYHTRPRTAAR
jgi:hypothetical protein